MNTLKLFLTLSLLVSGGMESAQACKARILLCILAICCFPLSIYSAHKITGHVTDSSQNPIPMATIRLLQPDSSFVKGTVTDNNGIFNLENIKK